MLHGTPDAGLLTLFLIEQGHLPYVDGTPVAEVQKEIVDAGELPESFLISQERISRARSLPQVVDQRHKTQLENLSVVGEEPFNTTEA